MKRPTPNRRQFVRQGLSAGAAAGIAASALSAASYGRVIGANDRIRIGQIGCGKRSRAHTKEIAAVAEAANAAVVAACDVWRPQCEFMSRHVNRHFGSPPKIYHDYRELLASAEIDAVTVGTPDHQHCGQLTDAAAAGKDVYVEKPICRNLEELNKAHDTVKASKAVVQHGTQGRSNPGTAAVRAFLQAGKLGKLFRVETYESRYVPYWNNYACPEKEADTDWKAFLYNRPYRPFDADQHGAWMGYYDFSSGPIGGWMSHFSDFVHAATGCGLPVAGVAHGTICAPTSDPRRTAPDNVTVMLEYAEGFVTQFVTHFGSTVDHETTKFLGDKGLMRTRFGHGPGAPTVSGEGSEHPERIKNETTLEVPQTDSHMLNWLKCIRSRQEPLANMDAGYMQGVAVLLGEKAYELGRKVIFDQQKREIRPA